MFVSAAGGIDHAIISFVRDTDLRDTGTREMGKNEQDEKPRRKPQSALRKEQGTLTKMEGIKQCDYKHKNMAQKCTLPRRLLVLRVTSMWSTLVCTTPTSITRQIS